MKRRMFPGSAHLLVAAALLVLLVPNLGCDEEAAINEFREASASSLSSGIQSILGGIVEGIFAVYTPEESSSSEDGSSSARASSRSSSGSSSGG